MRTPEGFTFWSRYYRAASILPDKKRLMFYDALLEMGCSGKEKSTGDDQVDSLLEMISYEVIVSHNRVTGGVKGGKKARNLAEGADDNYASDLAEG
jgi:hypothetical protein